MSGLALARDSTNTTFNPIHFGVKYPWYIGVLGLRRAQSLASEKMKPKFLNIFQKKSSKIIFPTPFCPILIPNMPFWKNIYTLHGFYCVPREKKHCI